jgi:hypothetical protein
VRVLDVASGKLRGILAAHASAVESIATDKAASLLATAGGDGLATVWSLRTHERLARLEAGFAPQDVQRGDPPGFRTGRVAFAPTGRHLLTFGGGAAPVVWDCETWEMVALPKLPGQKVVCAAWSPGGATYALGGSEGSIQVFDLAGNSGPTLGHDVGILHLAFDPSGRNLAAGTKAGWATIRNVMSGTMHVLSLGDYDYDGTLQVPWLAFSPDGSLLITTTMEWSTATAWDVATGNRRWSVDFDGGNPATGHAYFSPDGKRVYLSGNVGTRVVDAQDGSTIRDLERFAGILMPTGSERFVLMKTRDSIEVLDGTSLDALYRIVETRNGGHAVITPSGHVDGNAEGLRQIQALLDMTSYPLDSFASAVFDPKRCRAQMEGVEIQPARIQRPPDISLEPSARVVRTAQTAVRVMALAEDPGGLLGVEIEPIGHGDPQLLTDLEWLNEERTRARASYLLNAEEEQTVRFRALSRSGLLSRPALITVGPE